MSDDSNRFNAVFGASGGSGGGGGGSITTKNILWGLITNFATGTIPEFVDWAGILSPTSTHNSVLPIPFDLTIKRITLKYLDTTTASVDALFNYEVSIGKLTNPSGVSDNTNYTDLTGGANVLTLTNANVNGTHFLLEASGLNIAVSQGDVLAIKGALTAGSSTGGSNEEVMVSVEYEKDYASGGGGGGGLTSVNIENTLYVAKNGNDSTGTRNDFAKPYLTIAGATADASAGDCIYVFSGTYTETSVDTFGSGFFYYLEPNVVVANTTTSIIQDSSGAKTITIFGYGNFLGTSQPVINMTNASSNLRLQCNDITSGNQVMVFSSTKLELDCNNISSTLSGFTYTGTSNDSYINFNNCVMASTSTLTWRISHASGTLKLRGKYYEQDFARIGGTTFTTVMTADARLSIEIDELNAVSGGVAGNFDTTGNGVAVYNMLKKGGSAFDFGTDSGVQVDFYNCQMTSTADILQLNIFNGIVNCFNCYFLIPSSRLVTMQGEGTLQMVDCIVNQPNTNSIIEMTQTGGVGTEITPKLILQNVLLYNLSGGLGFSIDGTIVGTSKIPINVQGNVTATLPIDTNEIDNVITGNPIVNDINIKVTNTYLTNF